MFYFYSCLNDEDANRGKETPQTLEGSWCRLPSIKPNPVVVRSVRRQAAHQARWSTRRLPLLLDDFALAAEK
jgi:hypothetical protein